MAILNYTTKIKTERTVAEIQKKLASIKAKAILTEYDDSEMICAMSFEIETPSGRISFRLPANVEGVLKCLK